MGMVRIHCWGCSKSVTVDEHASAEGLTRAGWALAHGETYCEQCARARGLQEAAQEAAAQPGTAASGTPAPLEPFPVSAYSSESRLGRSVRLLSQSFGLLREQPLLGVFPVISFLLSLIVGVFCFGIWGPAPHAGPVSRDALLLPAVIAAYPLTFVSVYCSVALAAVLAIRLEGGDPTLGNGFSAANERLGVIAGWALLACAVGLALRLLEERLPLAGRIAANVFGLAWSLATLFAIPVLAYERLGPLETVRRSTEIFKVRWGSSILGGAGIGFAGALLAVPFVVILLLGSSKPAGGVALIVLGGAGLFAVLAVTAALEQIYRVFVYRSAIGLDTSAGPFATDDLRQPLGRRGRR
jgi:hypothetical protein